MDYVTNSIIHHPKLEQDIEVLKIIRYGINAVEHTKPVYIHLESGDILSRNFTNTDWNLWVPIPFNRQLHERLKESDQRNAAKGKKISLGDMSERDQKLFFAALDRIKL